MKISLLSAYIAIFLLFSATVKSGQVDETLVVGQRIPAGLHNYLLGIGYSTYEIGNMMSMTGYRGGPSPLVMAQIQWHQRCSYHIGDIESAYTTCNRIVRESISSGHSFCAGLTANSVSVGGGTTYRFFSGGLEHTWTRDNYTFCFNQLIFDQNAAIARCDENKQTEKNKKRNGCLGTSRYWDE